MHIVISESLNLRKANRKEMTRTKKKNLALRYTAFSNQSPLISESVN